jgi:hypothetical protein
MTVRWNTDGGVHEIPFGRLNGRPTGRLWLCGKHVIGPDPEALLDRLGADTVVCLTERHELADRYPAYVSWLERDPRAVWFPVHDLHAPPLAAARPFYGSLLDRLADGEGLIVHCAAGIGRAGTTAVALLVLSGWELADALAHVRAHRPMAGPEAGSQLELLRRLAELSAG